MIVRFGQRQLFALLGSGIVLIVLLVGGRHHRRPRDHSSAEHARGLQYAGSGRRIQRFLDKASRGEPVTVAVIGGSVSKGRGLVPAPRPAQDSDGSRLHPVDGAELSTLYSPKNMHARVFAWINRTFPHKHHRFVNGAQGAVGADYFGWCFMEHITEDADLVIIELGINDVLSMDTFAAYERLVRSVLEMENAPAVINMESFSLLFSPMISASAAHQDICAFYDVPSISLRDVLLPRLLADPDAEIPRWFRTDSELSLLDPKIREYGGVMVDILHPSAQGHALAADLMIQYLEMQLSLIGRNGPVAEGDMAVPPILLTGPLDLLNPVHVSSPTCRSMNSALLHHDGSLKKLGGVRGVHMAAGSSGWAQWAWKEKRYLVAKTPDALFKYDFVTPHRPIPGTRLERRILRPHRDKLAEGQEQIAKGGTVALAYQRSMLFGLGRALCWVDADAKRAKVLDGYWEMPERNMAVVTEIATDLVPGPHTLSCKLLAGTSDPKGRTEFRIIAVMHD